MMLWLFDIDGTLLRSGGAGRAAMGRSFEALYGVPDAFADVDFRGVLDDGVLRRACARWGVPHERERFVAAFERELIAALDPGSQADQQLCPGVPAVLEAVSGLGSIGLVTGNWRVGARAKLRAFGLWERFPLGGFSDDGPSRAALIRVATERARAAGHPVERVVMIGDTPNDVNAAREAGAVAVAVQTGWSDPATLVAAGPDLLLPDLERGLPALLALADGGP
jgi:phosphoglycolate phosphatase